ncbi:hypothetical protein OH492_00590 [Vibrio chagasii]|nr:hypothetical protein [Vibrio chagasii]
MTYERLFASVVQGTGVGVLVAYKVCFETPAKRSKGGEAFCKLRNQAQQKTITDALP